MKKHWCTVPRRGASACRGRGGCAPLEQLSVARRPEKRRVVGARCCGGGERADRALVAQARRWLRGLLLGPGRRVVGDGCEGTLTGKKRLSQGRVAWAF